MKERIKENLEPLNEQISMLTQLLNHLFHEKSLRNPPTASARTPWTQ